MNDRKPDLADERAVSVREGVKPTLVMSNILFDETTSHDSELTKALADNILEVGIRRVEFVGGIGGSSSAEWSAEDVHSAMHGKTEGLCENVRLGNESPDDINATVQNPR